MIRVRRASGACVVLLGVAVLASSSAAADSEAPKATFALTAAADGVSLVVHNESIPEVPTIQANTPTAQANTNSRGQSTSYSTAPDPGMGTAELPLTVSGLICSSVSSTGVTLPGCDTVAAAVPAYPYAYAQAGDAPQDQNFAAAHLHAEATSSSAFAQTQVGVAGATSATSTARTTGSVGDGTASTSAESSVDALALSTTLTLTGVHAKAAITIDSSGKAKPASSFSAGSLKVAGMEVGIEDGQFVVPGSSTPVPAQTVFDALSALGVTAEFIPAISTPTSVTSEGLQLSYSVPGAPSGIIPPLPALGMLPVGVGVPTTPTTVTYVLGRATVSAKYKALPPAPSTDTFVTPVDEPTTAAPTATTAPTTTATAPTVDPGTGTGTVDTLPAAGGDSGTVLTPPDVASSSDPGSSAPATSVTQTAAAGRRVPLTSHSIDIYLALVIAALGSFAAATAVRHLGVRLSWTS